MFPNLDPPLSYFHAQKKLTATVLQVSGWESFGLILIGGEVSDNEDRWNEETFCHNLGPR